jgi:hypothetical protein
VQAAREQWDQLRASAINIPKKVERKEPRRVTMANGKPGIQTSRGTIPARAIPAAAADDEEEEQERSNRRRGNRRRSNRRRRNRRRSNRRRMNRSRGNRTRGNRTRGKKALRKRLSNHNKPKLLMDL